MATIIATILALLLPLTAVECRNIPYGLDHRLHPGRSYPSFNHSAATFDVHHRGLHRPVTPTMVPDAEVNPSELATSTVNFVQARSVPTTSTTDGYPGLGFYGIPPAAWPASLLTAAIDVDNIIRRAPDESIAPQFTGTGNTNPTSTPAEVPASASEALRSAYTRTPLFNDTDFDGYGSVSWMRKRQEADPVGTLTPVYILPRNVAPTAPMASVTVSAQPSNTDESSAKALVTRAAPQHQFTRSRSRQDRCRLATCQTELCC